MHYTYVLQSGSDRGLYIGYTSDLRTRLSQHRGGMSFATSYRGPWRLIYYEAYVDERDALGREEFLKSGAAWRRRGVKVERVDPNALSSALKPAR